MNLPLLDRLHRTGPFLAAAVLIACALAGGISVTKAEGTDEYFQHCKNVIEEVPYRIGDWIGRDEEVQPAAAELLRPNKILQRRYINTTTGHSAVLMIVHCKDAIDMGGHYPPNCYPSNGWEKGPAAPDSIEVAGVRYNAMRYEFSKYAGGVPARIRVLNFFIVPSARGAIHPDMREVERAGEFKQRAGLGAGQVQIITTYDTPVMTDEDRRAVEEQFVRAVEPTIGAIGGGIRPSQGGHP
ncbi:MAG: exosortase-associated EpsI family protein [Phycisphaerae bacterium]|nr:exosortase-associated EpsI family protein [Phycisphaerae bacterium]